MSKMTVAILHKYSSRSRYSMNIVNVLMVMQIVCKHEHSSVQIYCMTQDLYIIIFILYTKSGARSERNN